jgi:hypothetical protein
VEHAPEDVPGQDHGADEEAGGAVRGDGQQQDDGAED